MAAKAKRRGNTDKIPARCSFASSCSAPIACALTSTRLSRTFYDQPCINLAKALLGKIMVREFLETGQVMEARVVETECYSGADDKGSHSYGGRRTERNESMYMAPGTAYVYSIYGMYFCFNISSAGEGAAVLIRSLEPLNGIELMAQNRCNSAKKRKDNNGSPVKTLKVKELCNGPSKLCQAMGISKLEFNKQDLSVNSALYFKDDPDYVLPGVVACPRIGLGPSAEDWRDKPFRFYIEQCNFVSIKFKT